MRLNEKTRNNEKKHTILYRVPNTKDLGTFVYTMRNSQQIGWYREVMAEFLCDGRNALGFREDGTFVQIDLLTGERTETKLPVPDGTVMDFQLVHPDVIYLTMMHSDHGAFYRLYIPTMTVDALYDKIPAGMPVTWLQIIPSEFHAETPNQGVMTMTYLNPEFLDILQDVLADKESPYLQIEIIPSELWEEDGLILYSHSGDTSTLNLFEQIEKDYGVAYLIRIEFDFGTRQVIRYEEKDLSQRWK